MRSWQSRIYIDSKFLRVGTTISYTGLEDLGYLRYIIEHCIEIRYMLNLFNQSFCYYCD